MTGPQTAPERLPLTIICRNCESRIRRAIRCPRCKACPICVDKGMLSNFPIGVIPCYNCNPDGMDL